MALFWGNVKSSVEDVVDAIGKDTKLRRPIQSDMGHQKVVSVVNKIKKYGMGKKSKSQPPAIFVVSPWLRM